MNCFKPLVAQREPVNASTISTSSVLAQEQDSVSLELFAEEKEVVCAEVMSAHRSERTQIPSTFSEVSFQHFESGFGKTLDVKRASIFQTILKKGGETQGIMGKLMSVERSTEEQVNVLVDLIFRSPETFLTRIRAMNLTEKDIRIFRFFLVRFLFASADKKTRAQVAALAEGEFVFCIEQMIEQGLFKRARHQRMNIILRSVFPHLMKQLKIHKFVLDGAQLWHDQLSRGRIKQLVDKNGVREEFIELLNSSDFHASILNRSELQFRTLCAEWIDGGKLDPYFHQGPNSKLKIRMGILPCDLPIGINKLKLLFRS